MELKHALALLVAMCVAAWAVAPLMFDSAVGAIVVGVAAACIPLFALLLRRAAREVPPGVGADSATWGRCVVATVIWAAVVTGGWRAVWAVDSPAGSGLMLIVTLVGFVTAIAVMLRVAVHQAVDIVALAVGWAFLILLLGVCLLAPVLVAIDVMFGSEC